MKTLKTLMSLAWLAALVAGCTVADLPPKPEQTGEADTAGDTNGNGESDTNPQPLEDDTTGDTGPSDELPPAAEDIDEGTDDTAAAD